MADFGSTQDNTPVLADDLMRDRARQFVEFLDDEVGCRRLLLLTGKVSGQLQLSRCY